MSVQTAIKRTADTGGGGWGGGERGAGGGSEAVDKRRWIAAKERPDVT